MQLPCRLVENSLVMVQGISSPPEAHLEHVAVLQPDLPLLMKEVRRRNHHYQYQTFVCSYLWSRFLVMLDNELVQVGAERVMSLSEVGAGRVVSFDGW